MPGHGVIHNPQLREIAHAEGLRQISFAPIAADADWFKASTAPTAGANKTTTVTSFTKAYCPGWPVCPVTVVTEASGSGITAVSVTYTGYDQFGDFITETPTTSGSGPWTSLCVQAFRTLVSVAITCTGTAEAGDTYVIGFTKNYGLGTKIIASTDVIAKLFNGAADAGTVSVANSTYIPAGTPDAAKLLALLVNPGYYTGVQK